MSSSFSCCFCPSHTSDDPPPPPPSLSPTNPNVTTYLYHTHLGFVSLTWSRSVLGRSLHLQLHYHLPHLHSPPPPSSASASFHLHIKPFLCCQKRGVKKIYPNTRIFWNVSKARFGAGPEPLSGFYVAVVVDKNVVLLVGDGVKEAYSRTRASEPLTPQILVLKREHVVANKVYSTKAKFGGRMRDIEIDCASGDDSRLCFSIDGKRVLQIKRLKWKFRGNEKVEVDGVPIQISWDVYNWLFEKESGDGHAIFMFKFEEEDDDEEAGGKETGEKSLTTLWTQQQNLSGSNELGKSFSSSSVSMSSSARSLGANSSVLEWSSLEENELVVPVGFSLLIYAWKS
ncbi:uncharacterized protein LOC114738773 [Neltuma alba]|uniref:uncharacterized protein LOC114738773 n=1 Tax=Neltuma alba TaxID=207710 RepID=UPI0010A40D59|nr:uncharacterized protein LOC114738773 [Prosopis alba]